jgi:ribosomal protein S18 acetylase RimI-like enzyme
MQMTQGNIRLLQPADLQSAIELSRIAGWNQTIDDWQAVLRLDPQGCFCVELDDRIVATTTLLCYGSRLAWIGMVLTLPDYRRRGFAQQLVKAALERAAAQNIESIKLDATADGQPLYEKLGFKTEQIIERWFRSAQQDRAPDKIAPSSSHYSPALDLEAFGGDRASVLRELAARNPPITIDGAYSFFRKGARANYLGPCVAQNQQAARVVIEQCLRASPESNWYWDLLSTNKNALELATEFGFVPQRRLQRMVLGNSIKKNDQLVYAIAGFELG